MKFEVGQTWFNRTGDKVRIVCTDYKDAFNEIVGLRLLCTGREVIEGYSKHGRFFSSETNARDLITLITAAPTAKPSQYFLAYWNENNGKVRYFKSSSRGVECLHADWKRMPLLDK